MNSAVKKKKKIMGIRMSFQETEFTFLDVYLASASLLEHMVGSVFGVFRPLVLFFIMTVLKS